LTLVLARKFITCEEILVELWGWQPKKQGSKEAATDKAQYASAHAGLSRVLTKIVAEKFDHILENLNPSSDGN